MPCIDLTPAPELPRIGRLSILGRPGQCAPIVATIRVLSPEQARHWWDLGAAYDWQAAAYAIPAVGLENSGTGEDG